VWTSEPIVAASWNVPINSMVRVQGLGTYRVADRGGKLARRHIDVLVNSKAEAFSITGYRRVCVLKWGNVKSSVNIRSVNRRSSTLNAFTAPSTNKTSAAMSKPATPAQKP
jgi:hypothetical protein